MPCSWEPQDIARSGLVIAPPEPMPAPAPDPTPQPAPESPPDQRRQFGEAATYDCGVTSSRGTGGGCPGFAERAGGPAEPLFPTATGGRLSRATDDDPQFYIDPDECIDCGACEPECPVTAIFAEDAVPDDQVQYIQINADYFKQ